jgi:hypothetical protein
MSVNPLESGQSNPSITKFRDVMGAVAWNKRQQTGKSKATVTKVKVLSAERLRAFFYSQVFWDFKAFLNVRGPCFRRRVLPDSTRLKVSDRY